MKDTTAAPERRYLTTGQVAALFEVGNRTVLRWAESEILPFSRSPGGQRRYLREDVEELMDATLNNSKSTPNNGGLSK